MVIVVDMETVVEGMVENVGEGVVTAPVASSGPPGGFQKGDDPRRGMGGITTVEGKSIAPGTRVRYQYQEPPQDGAPEVLQEYRHVRLNPKMYDKTFGQSQARELQKKDPKGFHAVWAAMEKEWQEKRQKEGRGGEGEEEIEDERCDELVKLLLEECQG